jgi:VCBS repeat-containing protein
MGSAHDEFVAGQTYSDSFTVATADGTTQLVTVNIAGSNDAAVISGFFTGSIETDAPLTITGKLDVSDIDGLDEFVAQSGIAGVNGRGSFAIDTAGNWTFTANSAFDELAVGQYLIDYAEVSAADGTRQLISITINGSNDGPVISGGVISGAVTEDTALTASGQLTANDADAGATQTWSVQGAATGAYGSFAVDQAGQWTYALDNANHQDLAAGESHVETFTVRVTDEHGAYADQAVSVTVNGSNDEAVISGFFTGSIETDAPLTITGKLDVTDIDGPDEFIAQSGIAGINGLGSFAIDSAGNWVFNANSAFNELAVGQYIYDYAEVSTADGTRLYLSITINGTNDGAVITGDSTASITESNVAQTASGQLSVSDIDSPETVVAQTGTAGQYGSFSIDATGAWTYTMGSAHDEFVAGQTYSDSFTVATADGTTQAVTVTINGTNDSPVITGGAQSGAVTEDVADIATGQLTATDPDTGARQFWTVEGGTPAGNADFLFKVDSLTVTRNGATLFQDTFSDGIAPPVGPDGVTETYGGVGSVQLTESGGKLLLDSDAVQSFVGIANSDPTVGVNAIVKTNINPANTTSGLKSTANFTASAVFDLILPDSPRENYGLRFTDRVVGGNGTPPDQLGDNVVDFRVSMREDGSLVVRLQQRSFVADTKLLLEAVALTPPVGADQIRLNLAHATAHVGQVVASFDYLALGSVVGSYTFAATGTIFEGENFTRADIIASAPAINDSAIGGTYGTLNVDQTGTWTYTLNDGLATTQSLAAGQTAFDTFTLQVTDENGASDSETVTITVTGTNDTPEVQTGTVSRVLAEDAAASLTASGAGQFADVDLTDTHTVAAVLTSAGLNNSATLPAGLQALLADAVAVTLPDVATGDAHGQYLWDFALANSAVQFLAAGQTLTLAYDVTVTDNHGAAATQRVNVTITGANDAPVITSAATASFAENGTGVAYQATATDAESDSLTYALGGTDALRFNINATTGAVSFNTAPNYEIPTDAGTNNVYDITVSASDGLNTSLAQAVAITVTDVVEAPPSLAGQSVIDLGSYGKLIAPVQVDGVNWFYFWDRSGNGTNANTGTLNGGLDYTTHNVLDGIFNQDINGVVETAGNGVGIVGDTDNTYRYATLNGVHLALPTAGGVTSSPFGAGGINNFEPGTAISGNAANATYNDLLAVWDAYNGVGSTAIDGTPSGWQASSYWSATPSASGHAYVTLNRGYVGDFTDHGYAYVALQVL